MECANARFANRCSNETSIRPRPCATFHERYTTTRMNRCFVGAMARKPHAGANHANAEPCARTRCANARFAR
eukprot:11195789-Lingulodinium_polyedra.AAC.1